LIYLLEDAINMKISVIVPVYNKENHLPCCIESVLNQTYCNFELILVDDGSNDTSFDICENYKERNDSIILYHWENQGQVFARNKGVELSSGEYILFLDADDYLKPNALQVLSSFVVEKKYDIVVYRLKSIHNNKTKESKLLFGNNTEFIGDDRFILLEKLVSSSDLNSMCNKLIRKQLYETISVPQKVKNIRLGEDIIQNFFLLKNYDTILFIGDVLYYYRILDLSASQGFKYSNTEDIYSVYSIIFDSLTIDLKEKLYKKILKTFLLKEIELLESIYTNNINFSERIKIMKQIRKLISKFINNNDIVIKRIPNIKLHIRILVCLLKMRMLLFVDLSIKLKKLLQSENV